MSRAKRNFSLLRTVSSTALRATGEALQRKLTGQKEHSGQNAGKNVSSEAARRLVKGLDELKGAAMKVGQMLSLENDLLPAGWQEALSLLQSESTPRPFSEMKTILVEALGSLDEFESIDEKAHHAASMSQVHKAILKHDGQEVALKIRYPHLKENIASDLKNLQMLMKLAGIVRREDELKRILDKVQEIFEQELDFRHEKQRLDAYAGYLKDEPGFCVAKPVDRLCRENVLVTKWLSGLGMDHWLKAETRSMEEKERLATQLIRLILLETFRFKEIQSDPNPANFLVLENAQLGLVDFGAATALSDELVSPYRSLACAALDGTKEDVILFGQKVGYLVKGDSEQTEESFVRLMTLVSEPFLHGYFDWKDSVLAKKIKEESMRYARYTNLRPPPEDLIFLNRRILGTELFLERLGAKVKARGLFEEIVR